ncbi:hypothetical protein [Zhengella mangrovi]|nr:hypothetical protein [Zhengella mangrovi]
MMMDNKLVNWFVPQGIRGRTNIEMARIVDLSTTRGSRRIKK